ncbi:AMP-binding protein [bacterium]|nr:AMP-binding protein [bacterium]
MNILNTLSGCFNNTILHYGVRIAYTSWDRNGDRTDASWSRVYERALQIQQMVEAALGGEKWCRGKNIAVVLSSTWESAPAIMAIVGLGAIAVLINPKEKREWMVKNFSSHEVALTITHKSLNLDLPGTTIFLDEIRGPFAAEFAPYKSRARPNDAAIYICTGGTTNEPKFAVHTHERLLRNCRAVLGRIPVHQEDRIFLFPPIYHILGLDSVIVAMLVGAATIFGSGKEGRTGSELQETKPTIPVAVPRVLEKAWGGILTKIERRAHRWFLLAAEFGWKEYAARRDRHPVHATLYKIAGFIIGRNYFAKKIQTGFGGAVRYIVCGGAHLDATLAKHWCGLGLIILNGYGTTEIGIVALNLLQNNHPETTGALLDGSGAFLKDGEVMVLVANSFAMTHYAGKVPPEDGVFRTGDIAKRDEGGRLMPLGRNGVIVLSNGTKIPVEAATNVIKEVVPEAEHAVLYGNGKNFAAVIINIPCSQMDVRQKGPLVSRINAVLAERISAEAKLGRSAIIIDTRNWAKEGLLNIKLLPRPDLVIEDHADALREIYR